MNGIFEETLSREILAESAPGRSTPGSSARQNA
jgi:hypothetical protein